MSSHLPNRLLRAAVAAVATAEQDIKQAYSYIAEHGPADPDSWKSDLEQKLASLESFPHRCSIAPESNHVDATIRQAVFVNFRILFSVDEQIVNVLAVRHGARLPLSKEQLDERL